MNASALTTASFFSYLSQARFMSFGFFGVGEKGWTK